ncbi:MAG: flagellar hook-basal body complex protein FliE [Buchnera aphidicola (Eriosoma harunire)]
MLTEGIKLNNNIDKINSNNSITNNNNIKNNDKVSSIPSQFQSELNKVINASNNTTNIDSKESNNDITKDAPQDEAIKSEESSLLLQFAVTIRNKIVSAYNNIMNIQL